MGIIFQLHHLLPQLTALENVLLASAARPGPPHAAPAVAPDLSADQIKRLRERPVLVGPPDLIVSQLLDLREQAGVPVEFVARSFFHTLPTAQQLDVMERLAEGVAPRL